MNKHEKIIRKYKNLLLDVFRTDFYQWLKDYYAPKVIKFDKETGRAKGVIAQGLPDKEAMIYSFSLLRQFLLKKDDISIYRIGKHIKKLGSEDNYNTYISYFIKFEKYANDRSGAIYSRRDEDGNENRKNYTKLEMVNEFFYGDVFHRDDDKFEISNNPLSMNKLVEYFLGFSMHVCSIAKIIQFDSEDYSIYKNNCPEKILFGE